MHVQHAQVMEVRPQTAGLTLTYVVVLLHVTLILYAGVRNDLAGVGASRLVLSAARVVRR